MRVARRGANANVKMQEMSIACPHCGVKLHLDRMQFASKLPLQVRCWNCSETVKLGSVATAALDSAAGAQPDLNGAVRIKGPSKVRSHSGAHKIADSPAKQKQDSVSNRRVVSTCDDSVTVLKAHSAAIHKTDSSAVHEAVVASAVHKADSRSSHKANLPSPSRADSPSAIHRADLTFSHRANLSSGAARDSRSGIKADSRSPKQPEPAEVEMGPRTIAVSSAKPHERSKDARLAGARDSQTSSLTLPRDKTIKISVMTGPSQGKEYDLSRPLVTLGRLGGGADIEIDDAEVSRVHCAVEMRPDSILLHDMRSTNGTFIGETRVFSARLEEMSTFRIGSTLLRVSFLASMSGRRNS